ncbi:hypothetical protein J2S19_000343 [Metabacillus malikii]|uniref:Uncharacterized protein n=1 Tax=Metabacillus malikii TaxID=1504265 RepID=A0ABT9ZA12_9BACI|nr:hypothetical protein [Metabacillus malikii]
MSYNVHSMCIFINLPQEFILFNDKNRILFVYPLSIQINICPSSVNTYPKLLHNTQLKKTKKVEFLAKEPTFFSYKINPLYLQLFFFYEDNRYREQV